MTVFTVGPATALAIAKLEFGTIVGADTGNGTALANLIVQTFAREEEGSLVRLPLLFLVGDKRRDIIPQRLAENQIPLTELTVYETTVATSFETDLDNVLANKEDGDIEWVVFFSPTGADIVLKRLNTGDVKVATIGPTTEEYLRKEWGVIPDMVSRKPEPTSMVQGIMEHL
jgi:uroporphyrinogen-III synthase